MSELRISDFLLILATFLGPILAVQAQKLVERLSESTRRKQQVFTQLMATRAEKISPLHVQALNSIELAFYSSRRFGWWGKPTRSEGEQRVIAAWRTYLDHLNNFPRGEAATEVRLTQWHQRSSDYLVDLLSAMAAHLNYHFDDIDLRRGGYVPEAFENREQLLFSNAQGLKAVLQGERPLKVVVERVPPPQAQ